ncbi:U3 snoRNP protein, partial [Bonamia ostreae]
MPIVSAKFIEKGEKILISGKTSYFMVYNFSNGSVDTIKTFRGNVKNGGKLLVSPTYTNFALTEDFGSVRIFDAVSQKETNRIRINGTVRQACFSADGKRVFAVG